MDPDLRRVNNLLANLRASQAANARRRQGLSGSPGPATYTSGVHNLADVEIASTTWRSPHRTSESPLPPGPKPPPSWKVKFPADLHGARISEPPNTPEWRRKALQLSRDTSVLTDRETPSPVPGSSNVVSLQTLCLRTITLNDLPSRWPTSFLSSLPPYIRQRIAFEAGIWNPLSARALGAIYGSHDVERIVVIGKPAGPSAPPQQPRKGDQVAPPGGVSAESTDELLRTLLERHPTSTNDGDKGEGESWDADSGDGSPSQSASDPSHDSSSIDVTSLALIHVVLGESIPPLLPHTLTHLSLVAIPLSTMSLPTERHIPLRLLSRTLPRLTQLDLSCNTLDSEQLINIAWDTHWRDMKIIGLRSCIWWSGVSIATIGPEMIGQQINARRPGRWIQFLVD